MTSTEMYRVADSYARVYDNPEQRDIIRHTFTSGARWAANHIPTWHDPAEETPERYAPVLAAYQSIAQDGETVIRYAIAFINGDNYWIALNHSRANAWIKHPVLAWTPLPEYKPQAARVK